ncbi:migration and invasion enhancer 1 isoform X2 [Phlebotomus argentipes]|uniref:migration and invasion enhancer 1 isoform X2 n=1 Tax=Phlebotomus argentipes TaxID=94469 RepID=UPI002892CB40|nr:migration and invasion enhancer 1 isoform X2 [Phlebotomus argentipes]
MIANGRNAHVNLTAHSTHSDGFIQQYETLMDKVQVNVDGYCNYEAQCEELRGVVLKLVPEVEFQCKRGRQGSFEVQINEKPVHSKLSSLAFPDFNDVAQSVQKAAEGEPLGNVRQQPITDCVLQ